MQPTWRQLVRFVVAFVLLSTYLSMFIIMGLSLVEHVAEERAGLADLVTAYGLFLGIVGVSVAIVVKDMFNDSA